MLRTETNKDTITGAWFPTRELFAIGNSGVQNIDRTTPSMEVHEIVTRDLRPSGKVSKSNSFCIGDVIVKIGCIVEG